MPVRGTDDSATTLSASTTSRNARRSSPVIVIAERGTPGTAAPGGSASADTDHA